MNLRRIAALLRELADEIDPQGGAVEPSVQAPRKKRRRARLVPAPSREPSPAALERARRIARREGVL